MILRWNIDFSRSNLVDAIFVGFKSLYIFICNKTFRLVMKAYEENRVFVSTLLSLRNFLESALGT